MGHTSVTSSSFRCFVSAFRRSVSGFWEATYHPGTNKIGAAGASFFADPYRVGTADPVGFLVAGDLVKRCGETM